ncbi:hypothetical protein BELL_0582g00010 [Botrytis elliptica]|uniref:Nitrogen regulatory protein areA GATA-like domain-containing protein n=1 Tax=Botrytis elliptica TaxID=278938 RepID=A0A4Z1JCF5_9HELO|nr:hypothetical protein EAE99_005210 [Botrytis elliptica]TGO71389.1 hypothetical protein BELL_0582g00010 [Botrytis elliptica]
MAIVLNSEENSYFSSSPLRRSHSQPKFVTQPSSYSQSLSRSNSVKFNPIISPSNSSASSAPSSPQTLHADSVAPSYSSTPASSLSLDHSDDADDEDRIYFPTFDDTGYCDQIEDLEPPTCPHTGDSYAVSPISNSTSIISRPGSPEVPHAHAEDDTALQAKPSRHVDYLSHNWKEEDIWASWKLIVSKGGEYSNHERLENASWRTWMKAKYRLKTVSPETLNWLKDCDVTWLYGPLQAGPTTFNAPDTSPISSSRLSKSNSFLQKKPILKKRSMSEIMLQRSLSSSSLLKQAAAAVQAQQSGDGRPGIIRAASDYVPYEFASRQSEQADLSMLSSVTSSGLITPGTEKKHISFNEQVSQCIALEVKGDDDDELDYSTQDFDDSDSDDGAIMMKRSTSKRQLPPMRKRIISRVNSMTDSKTIAMLPSTTLKYRADTPEPQETAMKHSGSFHRGKLSPSPSQDTLKPSKPSTRMLLGDDEDDDDIDWQPPNAFAHRKDSVSIAQDRFHSLSTSDSVGNEEPSGMRRTPSGMFMPYEEDEDDAVSEGLFGKVVDTVNTAKDIAHVIWNVGWRR